MLHRKLLDSNLWRQQPPATFKTAAYLILSCNHRPSSWADITIERGETFRTIEKMIDEVSMSAPTLRKALSNLEKAGFITRTTPLGKNRGFLIKVINYHQYQSVSSSLFDTSPIHENGKKHLNNSEPEIEQQVEKIYKIYPRKIDKIRAIKAIIKAINKHGFNHIFERTQLYAQKYNGDPTFIPYPCTFFNQERYNDDASEWSNNTTNRSSRQFKPQKISNDNFETTIKKSL